MRLLYPLGLLGLISIIILIIIYIIKPKYQEKKISSTYVWKLSLKYYRKKIPFHWLTRSLLFIIQVLTLLLATFLLTRPYLLKDAKSNEKILIIENSASMQITSNNKTRFEEALAEVKEISKTANEDQKISIIIAGNDAQYIVYRESSASYIEHMLNTVDINYGNAQIDKAIELANEVLNENYKAQVILYSDNKYEKTGYVTLKNMNRGEWNASILDVSYELVNGYYEFKAKIGSFNRGANIKVRLTIDGKNEYSQTINFEKDKVEEIVFNNMDLVNFTYAEIALRESNNQDIKDAYRDDNLYYIYGANKAKFKVEIIGENSIFTNAAIHSLTEKKCTVYVPATDDDIRKEGYDLYIFSGINPTFIPNDGHIWIINPKENMTNSYLGLSVGTNIVNTEPIEIVDTNNKLVNGLVPSMISVSKINKITKSDGYQVIMQSNEQPLLLNKKINKQLVEVVNIDVHYSNIALTVNLPILIRNLIDETLNYTTDKDQYDTLETGKINFKINCKEALINNQLVYTNLNEDSQVNYCFEKPGIYIVNQKVNDKEIKDFIFVKHPEDEMNSAFNYGILAMDEYVNPNINYESNDVLGRNEIYFFFALALLILLVVEWGVQYREQY